MEYWSSGVMGTGAASGRDAHQRQALPLPLLQHSNTPLLPLRARAVLWGLVAAFVVALPAGAVIKRLYPLAAIIADADAIYPARVTARDRKDHRLTLWPATALKGTPPAGPLKLANVQSRAGSIAGAWASIATLRLAETIRIR